MEGKKIMVFPQGLSPKDIELIQRQCENQHATSNEQILGFANAYLTAKTFASNPESLATLTKESTYDFILELAALIEKRNDKGFRTTPVRFRSFKSALEPALVPRAMETYSMAYAEHALSPTDLYKEFQEIHPFEDGNGRVGDLLWKIAMTRETKQWPETLPPNLFGNAADKPVE